MRNLKKLLAVVVAICVLATMTIPAFAAETKTDAQICEALGVLKGDGAGVTDTYLAKGTNRMQAAQLYLRLIGLEDEALAELSTDNFDDAKLVYAGGQRILAYLKANPDLGWNGVGGNKFEPTAAATAQMIYKVLLEAMGYKMGVDFEWADTLTFAADKGLSKIADVTSLTNNDMATAIVEALNAKVKGSDTTLLAKLIADGVIDAAAAEAAGLVDSYVALDIDKVKGSTNERVDILLKTAAAKVDASKISIKDAAGNALAIASVAISPADSKNVIVKTAAQAVGTLYTITIDGKDYVFTGMPKDTTKPKLSAVVAETNTTVKVTFETPDVDEITGLNPANYTIDGLTVSAAKFGDDHKTVILTTSAQTSGKLYKLKVANVTDTSGNVMDSAEKPFGGKAADTTKPKIKTVVSKKGNTVEVTYDEAFMLNDNALDIANYTINNDVTVTGAKFATADDKKNKIGNDVVVILSTSNQTNGKLYKLTVKNVADAAGNVIDTVDKNFGGSALDTTKIGIEAVMAQTNTKIKVTLNDEVDKTTVVPENFTVDGLTITAAEVDADNGAIVYLTTSAQTSGKLYKLVIANLKDLAGNGVDTDKDDKSFGGKAADTAAPEIKDVVAVDRNTVKVTFKEDVDKETAENIANYKFDGDLYYPTLATRHKDNHYEVELKTLDQAAKVYTLKISNVKDLSGNVIKADSEKKFAGIGESLAKVKLDSAYATDKHTLVLVFNQTLNATQAEDEANYTIKSETTSTSNIGTPAGAAVSTTAPTAKAIYDKDNKSVTITFPSNKYMVSGELYTVSVAGITGEYDAILDGDNDEQQFAGIDTAKADITIAGVNVLDKKTIELLFTENLGGTPVGSNIALYEDEGDIAAATTTGADIIGGTATIDKNKVKITGLSADLKANTVYYINLATGHGLTDKSGLYPVKVDNGDDKSEAVFATGSVDAVELKVDAAVAVDANTLEVYFNQNITVTTGSGSAFDVTEDVEIKSGDDVLVTGSEFKGFKVKDNKMTLYFVDAGTTAQKLVSGQVYDVVIADEDGIKYVNDTTIDLGDSASDKQKTQFAAIDTENPVPYLVSATAVSDKKVKVTVSEGIEGLTASDIKIKDLKADDDVTDFTIVFNEGDDNFMIVRTADFDKGTTYELAIVHTLVAGDVTGLFGIGDIKKTTGTDNWDNSVKFTGVAD